MKKTLFRPFEKYSGKSLLTAAIIVTLTGSILGYLMSARFDGVLDLHFVKNIKWWDPFLDNLLNLFSLSLLLFVLGKYLNKQTRFIDILVAAMLSRGPHYLFSLGNINDYMIRKTEEMLIFAPKGNEIQAIDVQKMMEATLDNMGFLIIMSLAAILLFIWYMALLYNGFKVASHAKGTKAIVWFILAILLAEILSKYLIFLFY